MFDLYKLHSGWGLLVNSKTNTYHPYPVTIGNFTFALGYIKKRSEYKLDLLSFMIEYHKEKKHGK